MLAVAESLDDLSHYPIEQEARLVPLMPEDRLNRQRAMRLIRAAGQLALYQAEAPAGLGNEAADEAEAYPSLMHAIHAAAAGDERARKVLHANVATDVAERTIKAGHIVSVDLETTPQGKIIQYGQTMESVHVNALAYAARSTVMRQRAEAETRNGTRIEDLHRRGLLQDYCFVVFSRYPDDMSDADAAKAGFFADTKSCAIQVTSANGTSLSMESAFVAGVPQLDGERHDGKAIEVLADKLDISYEGLTATQILDAPLLVHKSLLPNGVVDLVGMYDGAAGGLFFGQAKPKQDYAAHTEICRQRQLEFEPAVSRIVDELIAMSADIRTPVQAVEAVNALSQREMVDLAIQDSRIDPRVFGVRSAAHIEEARAFLQQGELEKFEDARQNAQDTAESFSCPSELTGIGGKDASASKEWHGGKTHRNKRCRTCKVKKPLVGACYICEDCVAKPAKMQAAYDKEMAAQKRRRTLGESLVNLMPDVRTTRRVKAESRPAVA